MSNANDTRGLTYSHPVEYSAWKAMIARCSNPKTTYFPIYGGRGIVVCERWLSFANFIDDMGSRPSPTHTLDRIDNDREYSKENCRWATKRQQSLNRRVMTNNKSGYRGVCWRKDKKKYEALVWSDYRQYRVGYFKDVLEAAWMRDQWSIALNGDEAKLNFDYE